MSLKTLLPKLKWEEYTSCSISADYLDHYTIIAIKGHQGSSYLKYIHILDKNINNEIIEEISNADELVALAYSVYMSAKDKSKVEFYNSINNSDEVIK